MSTTGDLDSIYMLKPQEVRERSESDFSPSFHFKQSVKKCTLLLASKPDLMSEQ